MGPTDEARVTLISCYPYRVNTRRIVVFAELADGTTATDHGAVTAATTP